MGNWKIPPENVPATCRNLGLLTSHLIQQRALLLSVPIVALSLASLAFSARGATQYATGSLTWDEGTTEKWGTASGGPYDAVWISGNDAVFEGTGGLVTVSAVTAHSLTFNTAGWVLSNGTLTLNGAAPSITTGDGISAAIALGITGVGGLVKNGNGSITLSGSNTYTGATTINSGTLVLVGSLASPVTVNDGATLVLSAGGNVASVSISGGGQLDTGGGTYVIDSGRFLAAGRNSASGTNVSGNLSTGAGGVLQVGATAGSPATLTVSGNLWLAGGTVKFDLSPDPASGNDAIHLAGSLDLSSATTLAITQTAFVLGPGAYPLVRADGGITGALANLSVEGLSLGSQQTFTLSTTTIPNTLSLDVSGIAPVVIGGNTTIGSSDTSCENRDLIVSNATLTIQGDHSVGTVHLNEGAVLSVEGGHLRVGSMLGIGATIWLHSAASLNVSTDLNLTNNSVLWCEGKNRDGMVNGQWAGVGVTVEAANLTVDGTSKISADGLGYAEVISQHNGNGPGGGQISGSGTGGGGGHGGRGGDSWSSAQGGSTYGMACEPVELGSSGGGYGDYGAAPSGAGGGAINLVVSGTLELGGIVSSKGNSSANYGGGAGGSILIETDRLTGAGVLLADGGAGGRGNGGSGGGGGGRIVVYYRESEFTGASRCSVAGGIGGQMSGAAGQSGEPGTCAFIDTSVSGQHLYVIENFRIEPGQTQNYAVLTLEDGATLRVEGTGSLTVGQLLFVAGGAFTLQGGVNLELKNMSVLAGESIHLEEGATLHLPDTEVLENCTVTVEGGSHLCVDHALTLENTTFRLDGDSIFELPGTFTITDSSQFTVVGGSTLGLTGHDLVVSANSVLLCEGKNRDGMVDGQWAGVGVTVEAANVTVDATSRISADGLGYTGKRGREMDGAGPGGGKSNFNNGGGAGHGGEGGNSYNGARGGSIYGSATHPLELGSGGGFGRSDSGGGDGGGAIRLIVAETLTLDGTISANGGDASASLGTGGGSGGSILVETRSLYGNGGLSANGGNGGGFNGGNGGGGGGRIAVYYQQSAFTGFANCRVSGGDKTKTSAYYYSEATNGQPGTCGFFDTSVAGLHLNVFTNYRVEAGETQSYAKLTLEAGAVLTVETGAMLNLENPLSIPAGATVELGDEVVVNGLHDVTLNQATLRLQGRHAFGTVLLTNNATLLCEGMHRDGMVNGQWAGVGVTIEATTITVDATSKISADGLGYVMSFGSGYHSGSGLGAGGWSAYWGGGGGYGGTGGNAYANGAAGGPCYGSAANPLDLGSSGAAAYSWDGGNGGGAIRLTVSGALHLDGVVSADGGAGGNGGAGAGGSIMIEAVELSGAGAFRAAGGNELGGGDGTGGGGGGGGRISVCYQQSTFTGIGACTVAGGTGYQSGQPGTCAFFDTSVWGNHLHVYGRFVFESGDVQRPSLITVEPGGSLVLANGQTWSLIDRLTLSPGASFAVEGGSRLTTEGIARLENISLEARNGGVLDIVKDVVLGSGAHITVAVGSTAQVSGLLRVTGNGEMLFSPGSSLAVTGGLIFEGTADPAFGGDVIFGDTGYITMPQGTRCRVGGNFGGTTRNAVAFSPLGTLTFNGAGTVGSPQLLEVMSADHGPAAPNFTRNFAFGAVEVTNNTYVKLENQCVNVPGATSEALYAQSLMVAAGATLDLAGFNVYVRQAQLAGTVVNGTVTQIPDSGPVVRNTGTPGTITLPGELDEWTLYGRSGETLAVAVNTGPNGAFAPVAPQIGYAEVLVLAPDGQIIGSASGTAANQIVTITGLTLPVNGQYRVQVHAPAEHTAATGNYTVAVWDAIAQQFPLVLNQQQTGTLPTPFSEDRWTFAASAGAQVRFTVLNFSAGTMTFDLTGPDGWTGFLGVPGWTDYIVLPSTGTYTLVAHGTGGTGAVSYSFRIEETTVIDLPPGNSYSGQFAGNGQAILFKIHLDQSSPLRVSVGAHLPVWTTVRFSLRHGQPPTWSDHDYLKFLWHFGVFYSLAPGGGQMPSQPPPVDKSNEFLVPMAAAGDWYLLAYPDSAVSFTVSAKVGDVLLESVSSSRLASDAGLNFTIKGCGFNGSVQVTLVGSGGAEYAATDVTVVSSTQVAATFAPDSVPTGTYSVRVATGAASQDTLSGVLEVTAHGTPKLQTSLSAPESVGYHLLANISVGYGNTGDATMAAPLLVLTAYQNGQQGALMTLDSSIVSQGFWTSAIPKGFSHSVQMLGSGNTAGLLQPGEWISNKAYYAGWQQPWDPSRPPTQFVLGTLTQDNTDPVDWASLKGEMRPSRLSDDAWDALWANFTAGVGSRWGDYVAMLNNNARYLGNLDLDVRDIHELLAFEFLRANGLSPLGNLASSRDAAVDAPGILLSFGRAYPQPISARHTLGAFGYGWTHSWDVRLETAADGTITVLGPGPAERTFQPDVRDSSFFADKGDYGTLRAAGGGAYTLQEKNGLLTAFRADGNLDSVADPNGNRVTATYTGAVLTRLTHSAGQWLQIDHLASGVISKITDSVGRTTNYSYDTTATHLLSVQYPDGRVANYQYISGDTVQRKHSLSEIANPGGTHRYFTYDTTGRLKSMARDGDAERVTFTYDTAGRVAATDAVGGSTCFHFDHLGRLAKTEDPLGRAVSYGHDIQSSLTSLTGPEGHTYTYDYDSRGNLAKMTDPLRAETRFSSGYEGIIDVGPDNPSAPVTLPPTRFLGFTDANGHSTSYIYSWGDDFQAIWRGNLEGIIAADCSYERWSYNAQGLPTVWRNRRGRQVRFVWDANGRLIRKTYPDGTKSEYAYDTHGNLLSAANPSGTISYAYNSRDELSRVDYPGGKWLQFTYDDAGRRATSVDQLGHQLKSFYDAAGRLERMRDENDALVVEYVYDAAGRISRKTLGNGGYATYVYDFAGQLLELDNHAADDSLISFFHYTYDTRGRRTAMETKYGAWTYQYDDLGQLTRATLASTDPQIANQDLAYTYDALGNRLRTVENGVAKDYTVNALNQYTQVGDTSYEFDADGNLVRETSPSGTTVYTYNYENRLVAVTKGGKTWQYAYDGLGNRVAVTEDGVTTKYVVDPAGLGNVVGEYDAAGNLVARYDHDSGLLSRSDGLGNRSYYAFDAIGNVQQLLSGSGAVVNECAYEPFGTKLLTDETVGNPFQFVGRFGVMHEGSGIEFMRARFYDPKVGQFLSEDPVGLTGGDVNLRRYVRNNAPLLKDARGTLSFGERVFLDLTGLPDPEDPDPFRDFLMEGWRRTLEYARKRSEMQKPDLDVLPPPHAHFPDGPGPSPKIDLVPPDGGIPGLIPPGPPLGQNPNPLSPPDNPTPPTAITDTANTQTVGSTDPNEKTGPSVYGPQAFVSISAVLPYRIDFENDRTATAPAQTVFITDQLGPDFEWGSFMLTEIGFGDNRIEIPAGRQQFETVIPMSYSGMDFEVHVNAGLDPSTGLLTVRFMSIDPETGLPPANTNAGFLPPEDGTGRGMGFVKYTVMPKPGLPTGTELRNIANITFDFIETIATNQVDPHDPSKGTDPDLECLSRIDALAPTTAVVALPATSRPIFPVSWAGADAAGESGLRDFTIQVSTDGGPFIPWLTHTTATNAIFAGRPNHTYAFRSTGYDNVGNTEAAHATADTTVATQPHAFDEWRLACFTVAELMNPAVTGESADPDHDGYINQLEHALWLDPKSGSMEGAPQAGTTGDHLTLTYNIPSTSDGIGYEAQVADDPAGPWSSEGVEQVSSEDHGDHVTLTVRDAEPMTGHTRRFMRVKVIFP